MGERGLPGFSQKEKKQWKTKFKVFAAEEPFSDRSIPNCIRKIRYYKYRYIQKGVLLDYITIIQKRITSGGRCCPLASGEPYPHNALCRGFAAPPYFSLG